METAAPQKDTKPELTDEYAQSLLRTVTMEYEQKQALKPVTKHVVSKKILVLIVITLVLSILVGVVVDRVAHNRSDSSSTKQLINSTQNFNNPNAY